MGSLSTATIERHLLALDDDAFVEFVVALWSESGWAVERDGRILEASRQGASQRLYVLPPRRVAPRLRRAPSTSGPIDVVVAPLEVSGPSELPRRTPDAEHVDAGGIRERLYYALDDETRDRLLQSHLNLRPTDGRSTRLRPLPPLRAPRAGRATATGAGTILIVAGFALLLLAAGVPFGGSSSSGMVDATEPTTAGGYTTASAPAYEATQNCERSPGEVVAVSTDAVRGSSLSRGLVVMGNFWNPRHLKGIPSGVWTDRMQSEERLEFYDASDVTLAEPTVRGDEAVVNATATVDGSEQRYIFDLSRLSDDAEGTCWVIDRFVPA